MLLNKEIEKLIYKDLTNNIENENWVDHFYDLWLERYHAMDIVRSSSDVIKLSRNVLLKLIKDYDFDELHLFKIYESANVFALLKEQGNNNWTYQFFVIYKNKPEEISASLQTVEEIKAYFNEQEPTLEIPLPRDRKYVE
ncbi:hypothetical protein F0919_01440 [Taibaiella lutea]|uniref:Uncharacterized protein n=1 Tax=Taibaiella lutea TaxID=2608001 RepID=A0A5M6CT72_9BACT|nr:hypothetical protein [Taibaiella lutea]KAA5536359.1 hypothetical protein F0919_01440 [Taibaiella lutea]